MSIRLPRYSGFPPEIFEQGIVAKMRDSAVRLYFFLCRASDRKSSLKFAATDKEITEQSGASPRALRDARINLKALGLIAYDKAPGGSYTYSLCDVDTGRPFPGDPKVRARYVKKERPAHPVPPAPTPPPSIPYSANSTTEPEINPVDDISFHYGHNKQPQREMYHTLDWNPFDRPR